MDLIIVYHFPCLDGAYSLLQLVLTIKFLMKNKQLTFDECLNQLFFEQKKIQESNEEQKIQTENLNFFKLSENLGFLYTTFITKLHYIPLRYTEESEQLLFLLKRIKYDKNSLIIFCDTFGQSLKNIIYVSQTCKKLLIFDHHKSFQNVIDENKNILDELKNVEYYIDLNKAANTIIYQYLQNKSPKFSDIIPYAIQEQLNQIQKYVEDYDIYGGKYKETNAIISAIFSRRLNLDAESNQLLFSQLLEFNIQLLEEQGNQIIQQNNFQISQLMKQKRLIQIKNKTNSELYRGYAVNLPKNKSYLLTELGHELAKLSLKDGYDNLGITYRSENDSKFKVSLRGDQNSTKSKICEQIAKMYDGGGHENASSCFISQQAFKQMLSK